MRDQIRVPDFPEPPAGIRELYTTNSERAKSFRGNFRVYNNLLGMATAVGNWSTGAIGSRAPSVLRINGQIQHIMHWNVPSTGVRSNNEQIYFIDIGESVEARMARNGEMTTSVDRATLYQLETILR